MKRVFLCTYFIWSFFCISFGQSSIEGKVISSIDSIPVEAATVILYRDVDSKIIDYVTTNQDGAFSFLKKMNAGIYRIETSRVGYKKTCKK